MHRRSEVFPAIELCVGDVGLVVQSLTYPNKNKTAKPNRFIARGGNVSHVEMLVQYEIESIYTHSNGNILINRNTYLRADTEITVIDDSRSDSI